MRIIPLKQAKLLTPLRHVNIVNKKQQCHSLSNDLIYQNRYMANTRAGRLEYRRRLLKMTQQELASRLEIPRSTLAAYETNNDVKINPLTLQKMCEIFQVSESYIEFGEEGRIIEHATNAIRKQGNGNFDTISLPVIPLSASASFMDNISNNASLEQFINSWEGEYKEVTKPKEIKLGELSCIFIIEGYSMYPHFMSGAQVVATYVDPSNWQFARGVHVISIRSNKFWAKKVVKFEDNKLRLESYNKEIDPEPMLVPISEIIAMWKVQYKIYEPVE